MTDSLLAEFNQWEAQKKSRPNPEDEALLAEFNQWEQEKEMPDDEGLFSRAASFADKIVTPIEEKVLPVARDVAAAGIKYGMEYNPIYGPFVQLSKEAEKIPPWLPTLTGQALDYFMPGPSPIYPIEVARTLASVPRELESAAISVPLGAAGASEARPGIGRETIRDIEAHREAVAASGGPEYRAKPLVSDIQDVGANLGFSGIGMAGTVGGSVLGGRAGGLVGGAIPAYQMSVYQAATTAIRMENAKRQEQGLPPMNAEEEDQYKASISTQLMKHGAAEAGPEALSNVATFGAGKLAIKPLVGLGAKALGIGGQQALEYSTETATQMGQSRTGLPGAGDPAGLVEAFKQIFPQTTLIGLTTGGLLGGVMVGSKAMRVREILGSQPPEVKAQIAATAVVPPEVEAQAPGATAAVGDFLDAVKNPPNFVGIQKALPPGPQPLPSLESEEIVPEEISPTDYQTPVGMNEIPPLNEPALPPPLRENLPGEFAGMPLPELPPLELEQMNLPPPEFAREGHYPGLPADMSVTEESSATDLLEELTGEPMPEPIGIDETPPGKLRPPDTWKASEQGLLSKLDSIFSSTLSRLQNISRDIAKATGRISPELDAWEQKRLEKSRANERKKHVIARFIMPVEKMRDDARKMGISEDDELDYMSAMDQRYESIVKERKGGNVYMPDTERPKVLAELTNKLGPERMAVLDKLAQKNYELRELESQWIVWGGKVSAERMAEIKENLGPRSFNRQGLSENQSMTDDELQAYKELMKKEGKTGRRKSGKPFRAITGRETRPGNPFMNQYESLLYTIGDAIETKTNATLGNLAESAPNNDVWRMNMPVTRVEMKNGKKVVVHDINRSPVNAIPIWRNGVVNYLTIHDKELLNGYKKLPPKERVAFVSAIEDAWKTAMNVQGKLATGWNLEFSAVANPILDTLFGIPNVYKRHGARVAFNTMKNIPSYMKALSNYNRSEMPSTPEGQAIEAYLLGGGSSMGTFIDFAQEQGINKLAKPGKMTAPARAVGDWLQHVSMITENMIRVSLYAELRKTGMNDQRALLEAKNITVDWDLGGKLKNMMNGHTLFMSAGVQGMKQFMGMHLASESGHVRERGLGGTPISGRAVGLIGGFMASGALFRVLSGLIDEDGYELLQKAKPFEHQDNMILMLPRFGGRVRFIKIPMIRGMAVYNLIGARLMDVAYGYDPVFAARDIMYAAVGNFNFIGAERGRDILQTMLMKATPSLGDPLMQLGLGSTWFGSQLMKPKQRWDKDVPDSMFYQRGPGRLPSEASRLLTENLYDITGGTGNAFADQEGGLKLGGHTIAGTTPIDIRPETTDHILQAYTSGAGRLLTRTAGATILAIGGKWDEIEPKDIPMVRRVFGSYDVGELEMQASYREQRR